MEIYGINCISGRRGQFLAAMQPGDLFQWVYWSNNKSVNKGEKIYLYAMEKWVPCFGLCLCVGINDDSIYWISGKMLLFAHAPRGTTLQVDGPFGPVIPQRIES